MPMIPSPHKQACHEQTRTVNLRLDENYCISWDESAAMREIIQNFLDGLLTANNVQRKHVRFHYREQPLKRVWTAQVSPNVIDNPNPEIGRIEWNMDTFDMTITNENVDLPDSVWYMGNSQKQNDELIGTHGEGMKVAILCLLRNGNSVTYSSARTQWKFFLNQASDSRERRVLFMESRTRSHYHPNLTVTISNVDMDMFEVEKYLPFSQGKISTLPHSICKSGSLLCTESKESSSKRKKLPYKGWVYVKGLFIYQAPRLMEPINLLDCEVNRDREILVEMPQLIRRIGNIWATRLRYENRLKVEERIYTKELIELSQKRPQLMETQSLEFMTSRTADVLFDYLKLHVHENVFPYMVEDADEAKVITHTLNRHPYACSQALFTLLRKSSNVLTIEEAQESAFVNAETALKVVQDSDLCRMVRDFVSRVDEKLKVVVKSNALLDTYISQSTFYISETLVTNDASKSKAIDVLNTIEFELMQRVPEADDKRIALCCKNFIASRAFWTYIDDSEAISVPSFPDNQEAQECEDPIPPCAPSMQHSPAPHMAADDNGPAPESPPLKKQRTCDYGVPVVEIIDVEADDCAIRDGFAKKEEQKIAKVENTQITENRISSTQMKQNVSTTKKQLQYERTTFKLGNAYSVDLVTPIGENQKSVSFSLRPGANCSDVPVVQNTEMEIPEGLNMQQKDGNVLSFGVSVTKIAVKEEPTV